MTVHEFTLVPADRTNIEALEDASAEFHAVASVEEKGAVFGQVWMNDSIAFRVKAHVFSGKAREHLHKHLKKAIKMQEAAAARRQREGTK